MKLEPARCCSQAGQRLPTNWFAPGKKLERTKSPSRVVPWLEGESPTRVWTVGRPAQVLQVVARHHPSLRVADQVDLGGTGRGEDFVDEGVQFGGRDGDVADPVDADRTAAVVAAVVEGEDAVAVVLQ